VPYGMLSTVALCFLGLCLVELLIWMYVGGLLIPLRVLLCGRWYFLVFYDVFGGKGMTGVLKIVRRQWRSLSLFS
jgi:hypothetical protein